MKAAKLYSLLCLLLFLTLVYIVFRPSDRGYSGQDDHKVLELFQDLKKNILELQGRQQDMEADLGNLKGARVEMKVINSNGGKDDDDGDLSESVEVRMAREIMVPPSTLPLNLSQTTPPETSMGQTQLIRKLFGDKRGGFFVECGALDGETRSNTLTLERDLGWEGLLIEGDWKSVTKIKDLHRKAWLMPTCLSVKPHAMNVSFMALGHVGRIGTGGFGHNPKTDLTCLPLHSMLKALGRNSVDYFSLDVEGHELEVLWTIPFEQFDIKALSVEKAHIGKGGDRAGSPEELLTFMKSHGYRKRAEVVNRGGKANDYIFVKEGFNEDIILEDILT